MDLIFDKFAIDLQWGLYDSKAVASRTIEKGAKALLCGKSIYGKQYVQGHTLLPKPANVKTVFSAALTVCQSHPTFIVLHEIDSERMWFCAASNGEPLAENDIVCTRGEAMSRYADLVTGLTDPVIIGDHPKATLSVFDVLGGHIKPSKEAKLVPPAGNLVFVLLAILIAAPVLAGGGWFVKTVFFSDNVDESALLAMQQALITQQQAEAEAARVEALRLAVEQSRASVLWAIDPFSQWQSWYRFLTSLPISHNGWKPSDVSCTPDQCSVTWQRLEGVYPSSMDTLPGQLMPSGDVASATTTFPLDTLTVAEHPVDAGVDLARYLTDVSSVAQQGISWTVQPLLSEISATVEPSLLQPEQPAPLVGREGALTLSGNSVIGMTETMAKLRLPGIYLTTLSIAGFNQTQPLSFAIEGRYRAALFEGSN